jgi:hypothetical protein
LRLLWLLLLRAGLPTLAARTAAASAPPSCPLAFGARRLLLLLLRRVTGRTLLRARGVLRTLAIVAIAVALPAALPLRARIGTRGTAATAAATLIAAAASGPLLELLHFSLHETPRLHVLAVADGVVSTVGAALPAFGVSLFAGWAKDAFRQWHRVSRGALYTSRRWTIGARPCGP